MTEVIRIKLLGEGAYGTVIEVEKEGIRYAQKIYKDDVCPSAIRELSVLTTADHPNIIKVKEITSGQKTEALLELCDSDLDAYFRLPRSEGELITALHSILCVLEFLHHRNLVHGDITPHNILVKRGVVKVADFGATRTSGCHGLPTTTVIWRAPESLVALEHTPAIDMWSFGAVAYECITGREFAERCKSESTVTQYILSHFGCPSQWVHRDKCPRSQRHYPGTVLDVEQFAPYGTRVELNQLLNGCLQVDQSKRLSATQALALPLFKGYCRPDSSWNPGLPATDVAECQLVGTSFPKAEGVKLARVQQLLSATNLPPTPELVRASFYVVSALQDPNDDLEDWLGCPGDFRDQEKVAELIALFGGNFSG